MTKKWLKFYFLIGTLLIAIVVIAGSLLLINNNIHKAQEKYDFESLYKNTEFDFKVPSPSYEQVNLEEDSLSNGIGIMAPYYSAAMNVDVNGQEVSCDVQLFPYSSKMNNTPYSSAKIIRGTKNYNGGEVVIDQAYAKKYGCKIDDLVSFSIRNIDFKYRITSISETNTEYDAGVMAIILTKEDAQKLVDEKVTYSAAYVSASDYETCKKYLFKEYKPYGRLKDQREFDSEEVYNRHYENFMEADWSQEITDYSANYYMLKVKYDNVDSGILRNQIIVSSLIVVLILVYSIVVLANKDLRYFMQSYVIKKGGTASKCANFFASGILYMLAIYTLASVFLYFRLSKEMSKALWLKESWNFAMPVVSALAISIIMLLLSTAVAKTRFSTKKL